MYAYIHMSSFSILAFAPRLSHLCLLLSPVLFYAHGAAVQIARDTAGFSSAPEMLPIEKPPQKSAVDPSHRKSRHPLMTHKESSDSHSSGLRAADSDNQCMLYRSHAKESTLQDSSGTSYCPFAWWAIFQGIFKRENGPFRHSGNGPLRSEKTAH